MLLMSAGRCRLLAVLSPTAAAVVRVTSWSSPPPPRPPSLSCSTGKARLRCPRRRPLRRPLRRRSSASTSAAFLYDAAPPRKTAFDLQAPLRRRRHSDRQIDDVIVAGGQADGAEEGIQDDEGRGGRGRQEQDSAETPIVTATTAETNSGQLRPFLSQDIESGRERRHRPSWPMWTAIMLDPVEWCRWRFERVTGWDDINFYSALSAYARGVLQFRVPTGLSVSGVTVYSPSFHKAVSVRPPGHGYWSVIYSSAPLLPPPPSPQADPVPAPDSPIPVLPPPPSRLPVTGPVDAGPSPTAAAADAATAVVDAAAGVPPPVERTASWLAQWRAGIADGTVARPDLARSLRHPRRGRAFLVSQRICEGARLETQYLHRWGKHWQTVVNAVTYPNPSRPAYTSVQLQYNRPQGSVELHLRSKEGLIGLRTLWNRSFAADSVTSMGMEAYLLTRADGGGLSIGWRHTHWGPADGAPQVQPVEELQLLAPATVDSIQPRTPRFVMTGVLVPLMGHVSTTYTAPVSPGCWVAAQYDVNVYSHESNLTMGMALHRDGRQLKLRASVKEGLGMALQGRFGSAIIDVGFVAGWDAAGKTAFGGQVIFA